MRMTLMAMLFLSNSALAAPLLTHTGRLLDATGAPINGTVTAQLELVDSSGDVSHTESHQLELVDGYYAVVVGAQDDIDPADLLRPHDVVITVGSVELGRAPLTAVPVAAATQGAVQVTSSPPCTAEAEGALAVVGGVLQVCDGQSYGAVAPAAQRSYWRGQAATSTARARIATNAGGAGSGIVPWNQVETRGADIISLQGTDIIRFSQPGFIHVDYTQDIICDNTNYGVLRIDRYAPGSTSPGTLKNVLSEVEPGNWASVHGNFTLPVEAGDGLGFFLRCSGGSITAVDATDWSLLTILWEPL